MSKKTKNSLLLISCWIPHTDGLTDRHSRGFTVDKAITVSVVQKQLLLRDLPHDASRLHCQQIHQTQNRSGVWAKTTGHVGSVEMDSNIKTGEFLQMESCVAALFRSVSEQCVQPCWEIKAPYGHGHKTLSHSRHIVPANEALERSSRLWCHWYCNICVVYKIKSRFKRSRPKNLFYKWSLLVMNFPSVLLALPTTVLFIRTSILVQGCH